MTQGWAASWPGIHVSGRHSSVVGRKAGKEQQATHVKCERQMRDRGDEKQEDHLESWTGAWPHGAKGESPPADGSMAVVALRVVGRNSKGPLATMNVPPSSW